MTYDIDSFIKGYEVGMMLGRDLDMHMSIEIITPPTKINYDAGELIDFTGIEVLLRNPDGTIHADEHYINGIIPFDELIFPEKYADFTQSSVWTASEYYVGDTLACHSLFCEARDMTVAEYHAGKLHDPVAKLFRENFGYGEWFIFWDHAPFRVAYRGSGGFLIAAAGDGLTSVHGEVSTNIGVSSYWSTASYGNIPRFVSDGKEVYYLNLGYYAGYLVEPYLEPSEIADPGAAAWAMVYGDLRGKQSVPVQWKAPHDLFPPQPVKSDRFNIYVAQQET